MAIATEIYSGKEKIFVQFQHSFTQMHRLCQLNWPFCEIISN